MCFRPISVKKREVTCPKCNEKNPMPLSIESSISDIWGNESGKAIMEKYCSAMTTDPRFKQAMGMTLKQIIPLSGGKITRQICEVVAQELAQLPKDGCKSCGEVLPLG